MTIKDQAIQWIKEYFEKNGNPETKAIIGISGGKDSSVVAALCCAALGKERVVGVMMPNSVQSDIADSIKLCNFLGIKNYTVNIGSAYEALSSEIKTVTKTEKTTPQFNTNTPSRLRMATLYGIAALDGNARISCNGNYSERLAGYFTIWGDGAGDFAPLANLFVDEVVQLGLDLGLPKDLCVKAPADGMSGKTDEDNLGFTYAELKKVATGNEAEVDSEKAIKIKEKLNAMDFKRKLLNLPNFMPQR